jgi:hypothetical protein
VPQELGWLTVAHLLERKELADALHSRGGQLPHELGPQCGVGVSFGQRGESAHYFCGISVVQLLDHVEEFGHLASDAGQEKLHLGLGKPHSWPLGPEWQSCMATLDIFAGSELSTVSMLRQGHRCGVSIFIETTT